MSKRNTTPAFREFTGKREEGKGAVNYVNAYKHDRHEWFVVKGVHPKRSSKGNVDQGFPEELMFELRYKGCAGQAG